MRQFDIFANPFPRSRGRQPFLINLQSDLLVRSLSTVVVAPLQPAASGPFADRLNPELTLDGTAYVVVVQEVVTVRKASLGEALASAADRRDAIVAALDLLFTGF